MIQPVILCGLGRVGWAVLDYLKSAGLAVTAVDLNASPTDPRLAGLRFVRGDCRQKEVLEQAGLAEARSVLLLTSDDLVNTSTTLLVRSLKPDVRIVIRLFNENLMARLGKVIANVTVLSVSALTAPVLALTALTGEGLGAFRLADGLHQVAEVQIDNRPELVGRTIADISAAQRLLVLAHRPARGPERSLLAVEPELRVAPGDRLVVCGEAEQLTPLLANDADERLAHLRWAGWLRRMGRIAGRTLGEIDPPVKVATGVLLVVLLLGTLVFYYGMNRSPAHGLFRTISLIATGADMHEEELDRSQEWQKVFVGLMRLIGAALLATFTAIVTNYLLRARLGSALEIRRIPDSGHIVICGLGNVGFRVAEELFNRGERVVVIERSADNRFVSVARRKGAAVIKADAAMLDVLRQAHAGTARAVVAATDNELANLEIALLVRELNPRQRVVVRLADPYLAKVLREAANVRLALSTSALAAPVFVAALYGDRVPSLFFLGGRPLAVVELVVPAGDDCLDGQAVRALSIDYQLLPMSLRKTNGTAKEPALAQRMEPGDTLTGILELSDLARLLRRERVPHDWAVEVTGVALPARGWLVQLLRTQRHLGVEEAEQAAQRMPICLSEPMTRGQAEDLLMRCRREKVTAQLRRIDGQ